MTSAREGRPARRRSFAGLLLLTAILATATIAGCSRDPEVEILAPDGARRATVTVEIANTPAKRELGLMYRKHLDENAGMLFIFAAPNSDYFWMRNTFIPLDMIFADDQARVAGIVADAQPQSEGHLRAGDRLTLYVLEVNAGFCARHGIVKGDRFKFVGFRPRASS
jgi:uncharacterized protein